MIIEFKGIGPGDRANEAVVAVDLVTQDAFGGETPCIGHNQGFFPGNPGAVLDGQTMDVPHRVKEPRSEGGAGGIGITISVKCDHAGLVGLSVLDQAGRHREYVLGRITGNGIAEVEVVS